MSYYWNGSGSVNGVGLIAPYSPTYPISFSIWVKRPSGYPEDNTFGFGLCTTSGTSNRTFLRFNDADVDLYVNNGSIAATTSNGNVMVTGNTWYHIGGVVNTNLIRLYFNGTKYEVTDTFSISSSTRLALCCLYEDVTKYYTPGTLRFAEFALWNNRTLSDSDFTSLAAKVNPDDFYGGPTIYVPLKDGEGYTDSKSVITLSDDGNPFTSSSDEPGINEPTAGGLTRSFSEYLIQGNF